jgi:hypothetical protein
MVLTVIAEAKIKPGTVQKQNLKKCKKKARPSVKASTVKARSSSVLLQCELNITSTPFMVTLLGKLRSFSVPPVFIQIIISLMVVHGVLANDVHMVEAFAGEHRVTRAFQNAGYVGIAYDIALNPLHDICSNTGHDMDMPRCIFFATLHCDVVLNGLHSTSLLVHLLTANLCACIGRFNHIQNDCMHCRFLVLTWSLPYKDSCSSSPFFFGCSQVVSI